MKLEIKYGELELACGMELQAHPLNIGAPAIKGEEAKCQ